MLKRTLAAAAAAIALAAGGAITAAPAQAGPFSDYWSGDFKVFVNTQDYEWLPQLRYSYAGLNITDAPCPGGWGAGRQPTDSLQQICSFNVATEADDRSTTISFAASTIQDPKTGQTASIPAFTISLPYTYAYSPPVYPQLPPFQNVADKYWPVEITYGEGSDNPIGGTYDFQFALHVTVPLNMFGPPALEAPARSLGAAPVGLGACPDGPDSDGDGIRNQCDRDIDGDGVVNGKDSDVDGDGTPNSSDHDIDGDDIPNGHDGNVDGDKHLNSHDADIDGDGVSNANDEDANGDGVPDTAGGTG